MTNHAEGCQRLLNQRVACGRHRDGERNLLRLRRHLSPRFLQNADHLLVAGFCCRLGKLRFQEHQAQRVLKHAAIRDPRKVAFTNQILYAGNGRPRRNRLRAGFRPLSARGLVSRSSRHFRYPMRPGGYDSRGMSSGKCVARARRAAVPPTHPARAVRPTHSGVARTAARCRAGPAHWRRRSG